jgi:hypothetical protein
MSTIASIAITPPVGTAATVGASFATLANWLLTTKYGVVLPPGVEASAASLVGAVLGYIAQVKK